MPLTDLEIRRAKAKAKTYTKSMILPGCATKGCYK